MALPSKTEMARDRAPLDEIIVGLERARLGLKAFRKTDSVQSARAMRKAAKAFRNVLKDVRAEADGLRKVWIEAVENKPT